MIDDVLGQPALERILLVNFWWLVKNRRVLLHIFNLGFVFVGEFLNYLARHHIAHGPYESTIGLELPLKRRKVGNFGLEISLLHSRVFLCHHANQALIPP